MADERDPDFQRSLRDREVSEQYRRLEPIEPPPELDQKILAAARQATESHAPLVVPAGRHRWYYGLAAAAVLVFAVALTLHLEREKPDLEAIATTPGPTVKEGRIRMEETKPPSEEARAAKPAAPPFAPDPAPSNSDGLRLAEKLEKPAPAAAAPSSRADEPRAQAERLRAERSAASNQARRAEADAGARAARDKAADAERAAATAKLQSSSARSAMAAPSPAPAAAAPENPERWLERIAELRSRGRHAEADRELVAFRKAYPNYAISNVMRERVEGTPTPSQ